MNEFMGCTAMGLQLCATRYSLFRWCKSGPYTMCNNSHVGKHDHT